MYNTMHNTARVCVCLQCGQTMLHLQTAQGSTRLQLRGPHRFPRMLRLSMPRLCTAAQWLPCPGTHRKHFKAVLSTNQCQCVTGDQFAASQLTGPSKAPQSCISSRRSSTRICRSCSAVRLSKAALPSIAATWTGHSQRLDMQDTLAILTTSRLATGQQGTVPRAMKMLQMHLVGLDTRMTGR